MVKMPEPHSVALAKAAVQCFLSNMAEWRVSKVMTKPNCFGQILIELQRPRNGSGDLSYLKRMRQPRPIVIPKRRNKNLRLVLEPTERLAVDNPVAVTLERSPQSARDLRPHTVLRVGPHSKIRKRAFLLDSYACLKACRHRALWVNPGWGVRIGHVISRLPRGGRSEPDVRVKFHSFGDSPICLTKRNLTNFGCVNQRVPQSINHPLQCLSAQWKGCCGAGWADHTPSFA